MKDAIEKAIEGGYGVLVRPYRIALVTDFSQLDHETMDSVLEFVKKNHLEEKILLDPLFWQALGKALGWKTVTETHVTDGKNGFSPVFIPTWHYQWLRFIDHLAEGKDAESFFNELLK